MKAAFTKLFCVLIFLFSATFKSSAQVPFGITVTPGQGDFCTPTFVTMSITSPDPNLSYEWTYENETTFKQTGFSDYTVFNSGLSTGLSTGQFGLCTHVVVNAYDQQMQLATQFSAYIGSDNGPANSIPYFYSTNGCSQLYVPVAYTTSFVSGRKASWYKNGISLNNSDPFINSPATGSYEYRLKLACGDTIRTGIINISSNITQPVISATGSTTVCNGDSVTLVLNAGYSSYQWLKNNASIPGATGPTYKASTSGNYSVNVSYSSSGCNLSSNAVAVTVQSGAFVTSSDTAFCSGDSVLLSCPAASSYTWKKNGAVIAGLTTQNIYIKAGGNYQVITTGLTCNTSKNKHVTQYANPGVAINQTSPQAICNGSGIDLTTTGTNINSYQWTLNNANIAGATEATLFATAAGNYRCIVANAIGCTKTSGFLKLTSNASNTLPVKSITISPSAAGGKDAFVESYTLAGSNFGTAMYMDVSNFYKHFRIADRSLLQFDLSSIPADAYINAASLRLYVDTVAVWTSPSQGLLLKRITQAWSETLVNWNNQPATTSLKSVIIPRDSVYTGGSAKASIKDHVIFWQKHSADNNGLSISMLNETIGSPFGFVRLGTSDNPTASKRPKLIITYTAATITAGGPLSFCAGDSVKLTADAGAYTYKWYKNNNVIASATAINYKAKTAGTYYVVITNATGCTAKSASVTVSVPCRMSDYENEISISPNPSQDAFKIESENGEVLEHVQIYDMNGKLVREYSNLESGTVIGEELNSGIYILTGKQSKKIRLVKL